jgi:outer membrane protein OmpA-like peptidoglycan-associated protein
VKLKRVSGRFLPFAAMGLALIVSPVYAQNAASKSADYSNFFEINVFGGFQDYARVQNTLHTRIDSGPMVGFRLSENFWNYVALEEDIGSFSWHHLLTQNVAPFGTPESLIQNPQFQMHGYQASFNGVLHFTPRDSKFRPFVTLGVGGDRYAPTGGAQNRARMQPAALELSNLRPDGGFQANYGAGIKYQFDPHVGLRADVRGTFGRSPDFGLPNAAPHGESFTRLKGVELTAGITIYLGRRGEKPAPPAPPPPPPPPPPVAPAALNAGSITASATTVCPGDSVRLSSNASGPEGHPLSYQWSVNGSNEGPNSSDFTFMPSGSGDYRIGLHVSDTATQNAAPPADVNPISIHVNQYNRPTVNVTATPTEIERGQSAALHANGTGSECSGTLNYVWTATEGTVSGTGPDAQFDSNTVAFNEGDRSRPQSKQVTVTGTVTDSKGGSATATANLTVNYPAQARHFGDIVFPKNSARVNNCGKRVLIEQLYPLLTANDNYDVVLVGHIDQSEEPRGRRRRGTPLDEERVLQTAAVLSGGTGTCSALDTSRIKGSWVGTTQETESLPTSCTISTTAPKERRGAAITDTEEAKNRRVEIWLVPKGMQLPAAARDAKELPDADLKRIGCPK